MTPDRVDSPRMPDGYVPEGTAGRHLEWADVEARLRSSLHYWLATTGLEGEPHVVPRWGVWLDGAFWYDGSPATRHVRNLSRNPACALHLEDGWEAVIAYGQSVRCDPVSGPLGDRLAAEFSRKYADRGYQPEPSSWSDEMAGGLRRMLPGKVLAWTDFPNDLTRFTFTA